MSRCLASIYNRKQEWLDLIGWWLLGVCSEFGFWFMMSSAHDVLTIWKKQDGISDDSLSNNTSLRKCNSLSAGFLLMTIMIPFLITTAILPFLPLWIEIRVFVTVICGGCGFALIGAQISWPLVILGLVMLSIYTGSSISTFFKYVSKFEKNVFISCWSSGIGTSGFFGSFLYAILTESGVSLSVIAYSLVVVPAIMAFTFWNLLSKPNDEQDDRDQNLTLSLIKPNLSMIEKMKVIGQVMPTYALPLGLVMFSQYSISQDVFELIYFNDKVISLSSRYRWFNFDFLISNLIFKSSGEWYKTDRLWLLALLQACNLLLLTTESIYGWFGFEQVGFWVVIVIVFCSGCVSGLSYVNTYKRLYRERPAADRDFSLSITVLSEITGTLVAGICSIPIHKAICALPIPT